MSLKDNDDGESETHICIRVISGALDWLPMSFRVRNAPTIYQRLIDNVLWVYAQSKGGWKEFSEKLQNVYKEAANIQTMVLSGSPPRVRPTHTPSRSLKRIAISTRTPTQYNELSTNLRSTYFFQQVSSTNRHLRRCLSVDPSSRIFVLVGGVLMTAAKLSINC